MLAALANLCDLGLVKLLRAGVHRLCLSVLRVGREVDGAVMDSAAGNRDDGMLAFGPSFLQQ